MKKLAGILVLALATTFGVAQSNPNYGVNQQGSQKITNGPVIEYTTDHSAVIAWSTKDAAGTYVAYGTDKNNLNQRAEAPWGGTNHRVEIKNLQPSATYYFQVRSDNAKGSGADVESNVDSFTTVAKGAAPDKQNRNVGVNGGAMAASTGLAQITHGPVLEYTSDHDAMVAWSSKGGADMQVKYGTDPNNLNQTADAVENSRGTNHRVKLNNLQPSTTYYIQMEQNGQAVGSPVSFQTVAKGAAPNRQNMNLGMHK